MRMMTMIMLWICRCRTYPSNCYTYYLQSRGESTRRNSLTCLPIFSWTIKKKRSISSRRANNTNKSWATYLPAVLRQKKSWSLRKISMCVPSRSSKKSPKSVKLNLFGTIIGQSISVNPDSPSCFCHIYYNIFSIRINDTCQTFIPTLLHPKP